LEPHDARVRARIVMCKKSSPGTCSKLIDKPFDVAAIPAQDHTIKLRAIGHVFKLQACERSQFDKFLISAVLDCIPEWLQDYVSGSGKEQSRSVIPMLFHEPVSPSQRLLPAMTHSHVATTTLPKPFAACFGQWSSC
jgi:hypothetical protein